MKIEDLLYSAMEHGKRTDFLDEVTRLRSLAPKANLMEVYEQAYNNVMNT